MLDLVKLLNEFSVCIFWCKISEIQDINDIQYNLTSNGLLTQNEYLEIQKYKLSLDKKRSLISRVLSRYCISEYSGLDPSKVNIYRTHGKKPRWDISKGELSKIPNHKYLTYSNTEEDMGTYLNFNISHDEEVVVVAISKYIVGIDIMKSCIPSRIINQVKESSTNLKDIEIKGREKLFNNLHNAFDKFEWEYIDKDVKKFMDLWTLKECFVKCIGAGLQIEPKRLHLEIKKSENYFSEVSVKKIDIYLDGLLQPCSIFNLNNIIDYSLSLCISSKSLVSKFGMINDTDNLISKASPLNINISNVSK
ncbi:putative 4'-phosphopantetheinyl transferase [Cryptosporidium serpentis]